MKLIIDILGNDNGPAEVVQGVIDSMENSESNFVLVGPKAIAERVIEERNADKARFEFIDTNEYISNEDDPARSIRRKKNSSIVLALNELNSNGDGFLTSGSTGALVAGGLFITKRIAKVQRAPLLTYIPNQKSTFTALVDSGAVIDTKASMLDEFATMGSVAVEKTFGIKNPKVYLLNIGVEEAKGDTRSKEAYEILKNNKNINFQGNIEARDFLSGKADVIVTDGFAGNIMLKTAEGTAKMLFSEIKDAIMSSGKSKIAGYMLKGQLKTLAEKYDYKKAGSACLLGVNKALFKAHGNSDKTAIEHAIYSAENFIKSNIIEDIKEKIND